MCISWIEILVLYWRRRKSVNRICCQLITNYMTRKTSSTFGYQNILLPRPTKFFPLFPKLLDRSISKFVQKYFERIRLRLFFFLEYVAPTKFGSPRKMLARNNESSIFASVTIPEGDIRQFCASDNFFSTHWELSTLKVS